MSGRDPASIDEASGAGQGISRDWTYRRSSPDAKHRLLRALRVFGRRRPAPRHAVLAPVTAAERWVAYFMYLPTGELLPAHRFTLDRLSAEPARLLVICACPGQAQVPAELAERADALIWKDLPGFDFSAYALALRYVARNSPGADLVLLNDSVLGPFVGLCDMLAAAPWDLAGLTGFSLIENHVQSYAFQVRAVTPRRARALRGAVPQHSCFTRYKDVVICQETRLARIAARSMTVGALWYADAALTLDPTIYRAVELAGQGFPFVKRSLIGRFSDLADRAAVEAVLRANRHPLDVSPI